jgi:hypothetical protein
VGLDLFSPHILDSLFSYRKGWLLYTPLMIMSMVGFVFLYRKNKKMFFVSFTTFIVCFYIVVSWSEWWYGAGFSNRPLITYYPILLIPMGYFLETISMKGKVVSFSFSILVVLFIGLNQFQWWQLRNYILDPYLTTKEYYWATFLKTDVSEKDREYLLVQRSFTGVDVFGNQDQYSSRVYSRYAFKEKDSAFLYSGGVDEFPYSGKIRYSDLTENDHIWIGLQFKYKNLGQEAVLLGTMMNRKEGAYGYRDFQLENSNEWKDTVIYVLSPAIRDPKDEFKFDFWKRSSDDFYLDDLEVIVFEKKKI